MGSSSSCPGNQGKQPDNPPAGSWLSTCGLCLPHPAWQSLQGALHTARLVNLCLASLLPSVGFRSLVKQKVQPGQCPTWAMSGQLQELVSSNPAQLPSRGPPTALPFHTDLHMVSMPPCSSGTCVVTCDTQKHSLLYTGAYPIVVRHETSPQLLHHLHAAHWPLFRDGTTGPQLSISVHVHTGTHSVVPRLPLGVF
jgi:hypothetical protein